MEARRALLLALATVAVLATDAAPQKNLTPRQPAALLSDPPATCESCKWVVKTLKCEMEDPDTQAQLLDMVTQQLCPSLPADFSTQCLQLAPALVPGLLFYMDSFSARELCSDVSLCGTAPPTPLTGTEGLKATAANSTCAMCAFLQESVGGADLACASLPEALQPSCRLVASALAGHRGCEMAGLCPPAWAILLAGVSRQRGTPPALPPPLVAALGLALLDRSARLALGRGPAAAAARPLGGPLGDYELCDVCKSVVAEAAVILGNPDTQREVLGYAKEACAGLGDFQNQCLSYVELYGPLVFNVIVQYLTDSNGTCAKIGYCPAHAAEGALLHASGRGLSVS